MFNTTSVIGMNKIYMYTNERERERERESESEREILLLLLYASVVFGLGLMTKFCVSFLI